MCAATLQWRTLIVEDDRMVARIHCRFLTGQKGFVVAGVAATADQARVMIRSLSPDLILLDLGLPGVDGLSLLRELRAASKSVEVIVVSSYANSGDVRAAFQLGVVDYLVKPFWPARLAQALAAFDARMEALQSGRLDQPAVDRVRAQGLQDPDTRDVGSRGRIETVKAALVAQGQACSADEVAALTGMARVTARRYLEELVALGECTVDDLIMGRGRPRKVYRPWLSGLVGPVS
jgi:response regulator of citrate/malate metabolism